MKENHFAGLWADLSLTRLVCENKVYVNKDFTKFSLFSLEGFRNYDDYLSKEFKGYKLNDMLTLVPDTVPVMNY